MVENTPVKYTSKILKATALLDDTRTFLSYWDESLSVQENLQRIKQDNILGKASRARIEDILTIFHQRYLYDPSVTAALSTLVKKGFPTDALNLIFYFFSARADSLLHDTVIKILLPMAQRGQNGVNVEEILKIINQWAKDGKTTTLWAEITLSQVSRGLLTALRDFGILQGRRKKRISPIYLPVRTFAFIAFQLHRRQNSGRLLVYHPEWQLFFLSDSAVERLFVEAHQEKLLEYHAAGPVIRIEFPVQSLEEYACALTKRQNQPSGARFKG